MNRLEEDEARTHLGALPSWTYDAARGGTITRDFDFADFVQAFAFMTQVALLAEQRNHHPEWRNVYRHVTITLTTHDASGLSMKDIDLARAIDRASLPFEQAQPR